MGTKLPAVDAYIEKAKPFAQPVLTHIREVVHAAVPEVEEAIKWSMPFFTVRGIILGNMAGFKEHCSFGLWNNDVQAVREASGVEQRGSSMGSFGRITSVKDLPSDKVMSKLIRDAAKKIADGTRTKNWAGRVKKEKAAVEVPEALIVALKKNKAAGAKFAAMSPSCQREYSEWIGEAKTDATRDKRLAQAMEWITEGKSRNWKYQTKKAAA